MKIIQQGAEAIIYSDGEKVVKERISKAYRIKELDETIRKRRTRSESSLIREARSHGILTPQISEAGKFKIEMEFIDGKKVKDVLGAVDADKRRMILEKIGQCVARLHCADIIHGDLTTSNFILKGDDLYLIDFGLGFHSRRVEDKAVDMHLLLQALKSTHFGILKDAWEIILNAYMSNYQDANIIIRKLDEIGERGRYK